MRRFDHIIDSIPVSQLLPGDEKSPISHYDPKAWRSSLNQVTDILKLSSPEPENPKKRKRPVEKESIGPSRADLLRKLHDKVETLRAARAARIK